MNAAHFHRVVVILHLSAMAWAQPGPDRRHVGPESRLAEESGVANVWRPKPPLGNPYISVGSIPDGDIDWNEVRARWKHNLEIYRQGVEVLYTSDISVKELYDIFSPFLRKTGFPDSPRPGEVFSWSLLRRFVETGGNVTNSPALRSAIEGWLRWQANKANLQDKPALADSKAFELNLTLETALFQDRALHGSERDYRRSFLERGIFPDGSPGAKLLKRKEPLGYMERTELRKLAADAFDSLGESQRQAAALLVAFLDDKARGGGAGWGESNPRILPLHQRFSGPHAAEHLRKERETFKKAAKANEKFQAIMDRIDEFDPELQGEHRLALAQLPQVYLDLIGALLPPKPLSDYKKSKFPRHEFEGTARSSRLKQVLMRAKPEEVLDAVGRAIDEKKLELGSVLRELVRLATEGKEKVPKELEDLTRLRDGMVTALEWIRTRFAAAERGTPKQIALGILNKHLNSSTQIAKALTLDTGNTTVAPPPVESLPEKIEITSFDQYEKWVEQYHSLLIREKLPLLSQVEFRELSPGEMKRVRKLNQQYANGYFGHHSSTSSELSLAMTAVNRRLDVDEQMGRAQRQTPGFSPVPRDIGARALQAIVDANTRRFLELLGRLDHPQVTHRELMDLGLDDIHRYWEGDWLLDRVASAAAAAPKLREVLVRSFKDFLKRAHAESGGPGNISTLQADHLLDQMETGGRRAPFAVISAQRILSAAGLSVPVDLAKGIGALSAEDRVKLRRWLSDHFTGDNPTVTPAMALLYDRLNEAAMSDIPSWGSAREGYERTHREALGTLEKRLDLGQAASRLQAEKHAREALPKERREALDRFHSAAAAGKHDFLAVLPDTFQGKLERFTDPYLDLISFLSAEMEPSDLWKLIDTGTKADVLRAALQFKLDFKKLGPSLQAILTIEMGLKPPIGIDQDLERDNRKFDELRGWIATSLQAILSSGKPTKEEDLLALVAAMNLLLSHGRLDKEVAEALGKEKRFDPHHIVALYQQEKSAREKYPDRLEDVLKWQNALRYRLLSSEEMARKLSDDRLHSLKHHLPLENRRAFELLVTHGTEKEIQDLYDEWGPVTYERVPAVVPGDHASAEKARAVEQHNRRRAEAARRDRAERLAKAKVEAPKAAPVPIANLVEEMAEGECQYRFGKQWLKEFPREAFTDDDLLFRGNQWDDFPAHRLNLALVPPNQWQLERTRGTARLLLGGGSSAWREGEDPLQGVPSPGNLDIRALQGMVRSLNAQFGLRTPGSGGRVTRLPPSLPIKKGEPLTTENDPAADESALMTFLLPKLPFKLKRRLPGANPPEDWPTVRVEERFLEFDDKEIKRNEHIDVAVTRILGHLALDPTTKKESAELEYHRLRAFMLGLVSKAIGCGTKSGISESYFKLIPLILTKLQLKAAALEEPERSQLNALAERLRHQFRTLPIQYLLTLKDRDAREAWASVLSQQAMASANRLNPGGPRQWTGMVRFDKTMNPEFKRMLERINNSLLLGRISDDDRYTLQVINGYGFRPSGAFEFLAGDAPSAYYREVLRGRDIDEMRSLPVRPTDAQLTVTHLTQKTRDPKRTWSSHWFPGFSMTPIEIRTTQDADNYLKDTLNEGKSHLINTPLTCRIPAEERGRLRAQLTRDLNGLKGGGGNAFILERAYVNVLKWCDAPPEAFRAGVVDPIADTPLAWDYGDLLQLEQQVQHQTESRERDRPTLNEDLTAIENYLNRHTGGGIPAQIRIALLRLPRVHRRQLATLAQEADGILPSKEMLEVIFEPSVDGVFGLLDKALRHPEAKGDRFARLSKPLNEELARYSRYDLKLLPENLGRHAEREKLRGHLFHALAYAKGERKEGRKVPYALTHSADGEAMALLANLLDERGHAPNEKRISLPPPRAGQKGHAFDRTLEVLGEAVDLLRSQVDEKGHAADERRKFLLDLRGGERRHAPTRALEILADEELRYRSASEKQRKAIDDFSRYLLEEGKIALPSNSRVLLLRLSDQDIDKLYALKDYLTSEAANRQNKGAMKELFQTLLLKPSAGEIGMVFMNTRPKLYSALVAAGLIDPIPNEERSAVSAREARKRSLARAIEEGLARGEPIEKIKDPNQPEKLAHEELLRLFAKQKVAPELFMALIGDTTPLSPQEEKEAEALLKKVKGRETEVLKDRTQFGAPKTPAGKRIEEAAYLALLKEISLSKDEPLKRAAAEVVQREFEAKEAESDKLIATATEYARAQGHWKIPEDQREKARARVERYLEQMKQRKVTPPLVETEMLAHFGRQGKTSLHQFGDDGENDQAIAEALRNPELLVLGGVSPSDHLEALYAHRLLIEQSSKSKSEEVLKSWREARDRTHVRAQQGELGLRQDAARELIRKANLPTTWPDIEAMADEDVAWRLQDTLEKAKAADGDIDEKKLTEPQKKLLAEEREKLRQEILHRGRVKEVHDKVKALLEPVYETGALPIAISALFAEAKIDASLSPHLATFVRGHLEKEGDLLSTQLEALQKQFEPRKSAIEARQGALDREMERLARDLKVKEIKIVHEAEDMHEELEKRKGLSSGEIESMKKAWAERIAQTLAENKQSLHQLERSQLPARQALERERQVLNSDYGVEQGKAIDRWAHDFIHPDGAKSEEPREQLRVSTITPSSEPINRRLKEVFNETYLIHGPASEGVGLNPAIVEMAKQRAAEALQAYAGVEYQLGFVSNAVHEMGGGKNPDLNFRRQLRERTLTQLTSGNYDSGKRPMLIFTEGQAKALVDQYDRKASRHAADTAAALKRILGELSPLGELLWDGKFRENELRWQLTDGSILSIRQLKLWLLNDKEPESGLQPLLRPVEQLSRFLANEPEPQPEKFRALLQELSKHTVENRDILQDIQAYARDQYDYWGQFGETGHSLADQVKVQIGDYRPAPFEVNEVAAGTIRIEAVKEGCPEGQQCFRERVVFENLENRRKEVKKLVERNELLHLELTEKISDRDDFGTTSRRVGSAMFVDPFVAMAGYEPFYDNFAIDREVKDLQREAMENRKRLGQAGTIQVQLPGERELAGGKRTEKKYSARGLYANALDGEGRMLRFEAGSLGTRHENIDAVRDAGLIAITSIGTWGVGGYLATALHAGRLSWAAPILAGAQRFNSQLKVAMTMAAVNQVSQVSHENARAVYEIKTWLEKVDDEGVPFDPKVQIPAHLDLGRDGKLDFVQRGKDWSSIIVYPSASEFVGEVRNATATLTLNPAKLLQRLPMGKATANMIGMGGTSYVTGVGFQLMEGTPFSQVFSEESQTKHGMQSLKMALIAFPLDEYAAARFSSSALQYGSAYGVNAVQSIGLGYAGKYGLLGEKTPIMSKASGRAAEGTLDEVLTILSQNAGSDHMATKGAVRQGRIANLEKDIATGRRPLQEVRADPLYREVLKEMTSQQINTSKSRDELIKDYEKLKGLDKVAPGALEKKLKAANDKAERETREMGKAAKDVAFSSAAWHWLKRAWHRNTPVENHVATVLKEEGKKARTAFLHQGKGKLEDIFTPEIVHDLKTDRYELKDRTKRHELERDWIWRDIRASEINNVNDVHADLVDLIAQRHGIRDRHRIATILTEIGIYQRARLEEYRGREFVDPITGTKTEVKSMLDVQRMGGGETLEAFIVRVGARR